MISTVTAALSHLVTPQLTLAVPFEPHLPTEIPGGGFACGYSLHAFSSGKKATQTAQSNLHPTTNGDDLMWVVKNVEWTLFIPTAGSTHCTVHLTGAVQGGDGCEWIPPHLPPHSLTQELQKKHTNAIHATVTFCPIPQINSAAAPTVH